MSVLIKYHFVLVLCVCSHLIFHKSFVSSVTADNYSLFDEDPRRDFHRKPIVIIPGVLGSQLDARLNKPYALKNCEKISDWYTLWLDPKQLIPGFIDCWVDNLKLRYDNITDRTRNSPGVQIRVPQFGSTVPFEYLDSSSLNLGEYFAPFVNFLTGKLRYKRQVDLFGAAYDWRLSPRQHGELFKSLALLIEQAHHMNNKKVVIISHSMGSPYTNYFLNNQSREWRNKFVDSFVSISGSFFGSLKSMKAVVSGDAEGFGWFINELKMQKLARTFPSFIYMLPRPNLWPNEEATVIVTSKRNYTVHDYETLFQEIGCEWCWNLWKDSVVGLDDFAAPNVPVHCIYSSGVPTFQTLIYKSGFPNSSPGFVYNDGDGTINSWSSSACKLWKQRQKEPVYSLNLRHNTHVKILSNSDLHKYLLEVVAA